MKKGLIILFTLLLFAFSARLNLSSAYLRDLSFSYTNGGWGTSYTMGYRFTPTSNNTVTQLCAYVGGTSTVYLWNDAGSLITSASVNSTGPTWACTNITPVAVTAGTYYRVGTCQANYYFTGFTDGSTTTGITISGTEYSSGCGAFPTNYAPGYMYGLADVTLGTAATNTPTPIPSPTPALTCYGSSSTINTRTYYKGPEGTYIYMPTTSLLGYGDCAPNDSTKWRMLSCPSGSPTTLSYTGGVQTYTVPAGVTSLQIEAWGGEGGSTTYGAGGKGGYVSAIYTVTPGTTYYVYVGGAASGATAGYNGGGAYGAAYSSYDGSAGGGASDVRTVSGDLSTRIIVAGGGGGAGGRRTEYGVPGGGGDGGDTTGETGENGSYSRYSTYIGYGGGGGTPSAGGSAGVCGYSSSYNGQAGDTGSLGTGGTGGQYASSSSYTGGGGGGGGYHGGGGGGAARYEGGGGGGGGSSYTGSGTSVTHTQGNRSGNGQVIFTPQPNDVCAGAACP
jgi:hypothetical protein